MKAILLAAGRGLRMDEYGVAKPLLYLREGETILGRLVRQVAALGFDPVIVVGYDPQRFMQAFWDKATFAYYPPYATTGPLNALLAVSQFVQGELLVAYADTVIDNATLEAVVAQFDSAVVGEHDGYSGARFRAENDIIVEVAPPEETSWPLGFGGFAYLSRETLGRIDRVPDFERRTIGFALRGCRTVVGKTVNVNTADDLERARKEFA